ncbi:RNA 2',3'-cyclic phosphodiesterase [Nocardioides sp. STR2]|uniref:RNA 2',3'-cyclic phosphodiesterase n=1 Tax=Nocardioides pini TaxID=2975053 RepID=A0ABT4CGA0_9ACTN|nr:RNA 2',3'-cyclic phosphodiesterase [Nocardioides pini]MCY4727990.1 RNA 2',3'-cyclic phosphodiesterase [Nocardioides pini]
MFVAAVPPEEAVAHLDEFLAVRRDAASYRWTVPEQWHLTLAFAEDVPDRSLDDLEARLERAARKRRPVRLRLAGGGAFPHPDRARVLFARLDADEGGRTELDRLATGCRTALAKAGARVDGQRFRAHLTLARLGQPDNVTSWVRLLDGYEGPEWELDEVALVASYLGEGPRRRPRHEVVGTYALG